VAGYVVRQFTRPKAVTHPTANQSLGTAYCDVICSDAVLRCAVGDASVTRWSYLERRRKRHARSGRVRRVLGQSAVAIASRCSTQTSTFPVPWAEVSCAFCSRQPTVTRNTASDRSFRVGSV